MCQQISRSQHFNRHALCASIVPTCVTLPRSTHTSCRSEQVDRGKRLRGSTAAGSGDCLSQHPGLACPHQQQLSHILPQLLRQHGSTCICIVAHILKLLHFDIIRRHCHMLSSVHACKVVQGGCQHAHSCRAAAHSSSLLLSSHCRLCKLQQHRSLLTILPALYPLLPAACRVKDTLKKVTGKGHEHEVSIFCWLTVPAMMHFHADVQLHIVCLA